MTAQAGGSPGSGAAPAVAAGEAAREDAGLQIETIELFGVELRLFRPFTVSFGALGQRRLLVRLRTRSGLEGWGDTGHFLPEYSGERMEAALAHAEYVVPLVLGANVWDIGLIHERLDRALHGSVQLKAAIDIACYDLMARSSGLPLHRLFGGRRVDRLETQLDISIGSVDEVLADVERAVGLGVKSVGLKVGPPASPSVQHDISLVRSVREHFGPDLEIWIDCNGGYARTEAVRAIRAFETYDVGLVEQPVPGWDLEGMAYVAERVNTPLTADESVWTTHDIYQVVRAGAASVIHTKIPKAAGLWGTRNMAVVCEALGVPLTVASLALSDYGQAALIHFLTAHPVCHVYRHKLRGGGLFFPTDFVEERLQLVDGGFAVPSGPGVGLRIDEQAVRRAALTTRTFRAADL